jgi:hypothetical protein
LTSYEKPAVATCNYGKPHAHSQQADEEFATTINKVLLTKRLRARAPGEFECSLNPALLFGNTAHQAPLQKCNVPGASHPGNARPVAGSPEFSPFRRSWKT